GGAAQAHDLEDAVVGLGHRRDLHSAAEKAAIADRELPRLDLLLLHLSAQGQRALQNADRACEKAPERGDEIRHRAAGLPAPFRDVAIDQAADAGREDVDEVRGLGASVLRGVGKPADIDGARPAACNRGAVAIETVLETERFSEVAAGALA